MTEFTKVQECLEFCNTNHLAFFRRDLNQNFAKIMVADSFQNIYNKIIKGENKYYESWGTNQYMKLYIDYEKKSVNIEEDLNINNQGNYEQGSSSSSKDPIKDQMKKRMQKVNDDQFAQISHKNDILNIINHIKNILPNITAVHILKSIPDTDKKSYHIIFEGIHFVNYRIMKIFIEEQLKPKFKELFEKKIIDTTVYAPKCFRSLLCSKYGQNRPLFLLETNAFLSSLEERVILKEDTTFEMFKKSCITFIDGNSVLYNYKSTEKKKDNTANKK